MDFGSEATALIVAFLVTVLELTEVVALVYALSASSSKMSHIASGAFLGVLTVSLATLVTGVTILAIFTNATFFVLLISALLLWGFGAGLFRSTVKTYYREAKKKYGVDDGWRSSHHDEVNPNALFTVGFSVGATETLEAMVVLLGLDTGGYGYEAFVGFLGGGFLLLTLGYLLHERIRRVKVPQLKLAGSTMVFTFAIFWTGEALAAVHRFSFPYLGVGAFYEDIILIPIGMIVYFTVWLAVEFRVRQKLLPYMPEYVGTLGEESKEKGDLKRAVSRYKKAAAGYRDQIRKGKSEFEPELAEVEYNLAISLGEREDPEGEIGSYREAERIWSKLESADGKNISPKLARLRNNLGSALANSGKLEDAVDSYRSSEEGYHGLVEAGRSDLIPDYADLMMNLGSSCEDLEDYKNSVIAFSTAVDLYQSLTEQRKDVFRPMLANALSSLGKVQELHGEKGPALQSLKRSEELYEALVNEGKKEFIAPLGVVRSSIRASIAGVSSSDEVSRQ